MSVSRREAERIATLARLHLEAEELERLTSDLNVILKHVDVLRSLKLVEASDLTPQLREALPSTRSEAAEIPDALLRPPGDIAPDWRDGFFVVPPPPRVRRSDGDGA